MKPSRIKIAFEAPLRDDPALQAANEIILETRAEILRMAEIWQEQAQENTEWEKGDFPKNKISRAARAIIEPDFT